MKNNLKKQFPIVHSDKEAEDFVSNADLSEYNLADFKKTTFEFAPKSHSVSLRLSENLYVATQHKAQSLGMKTQQFMRQAIEGALAG